MKIYGTADFKGLTSAADKKAARILRKLSKADLELLCDLVGLIRGSKAAMADLLIAAMTR